MTLIAAFTVIDRPVMIGDLLLSSSGQISTLPSLNVPSFSDVNSLLPEDAGAVIIGLRRKLVPINDVCVMAWAGMEIVARSVCRDIREFLKENNDYVELGRFIKALKPAEFGKGVDFSFCVMFVDAGKMKIIGWNGNKFENGYCCGTGSDDFLTVIDKILFKSGIEQGEDPVVESILSALSVTASLLGEQIATGESIKSFYGGGFEVATPYGDKINFVPVTYWFLSCILEASGEVKITVHSVLIFDYSQDVLIVHRFLLDQMDTQREVYILSPLYRAVEDGEARTLGHAWSPTDFSYAYIAFPQMGNDKRIYGIGGYKTDGLKIVAINDDQLEIEISEEFRQHLYDHMRLKEE